MKEKKKRNESKVPAASFFPGFSGSSTEVGFGLVLKMASGKNTINYDTRAELAELVKKRAEIAVCIVLVMSTAISMLHEACLNNTPLMSVVVVSNTGHTREP